MLLEIKGKHLVPLDLGKLYMLGKQINGDKIKTKNFIELDDEENVSQRHCVIETNHNEEAFVFDLFSSKGTVLNNKILISLEKTLLKNGDVVKIGEIEIKYIYQGHEMSRDSSGFLEVPKNTSDIVSSPESTSQFENRVKRLGDHNFLIPTRPSTSLSNRRSDSFTIPETQHCKPRNSINDSNVSIAESIPDNNEGKIKFNFGNLDSFEDDDLCIPETQELITVEGISCSQRPRLLSSSLNKANETSVLNEESPTSEKVKAVEESQFRICTQDFNDGFGEEEHVDSLHSQIIPIIKHSTVVLNKTMDSSKTDLVNHSNLDQEEKEISFLKWSNTKTDQETTELRADCLTPDIFEFEAITNKISDNIGNQGPNIIDEDEEDLLPTQCLPSVLKTVEEKKSLNKLEEPCLDKEIEEVLILSDKENRCPEREPVADMPRTQLFEARSHTSISNSNSISSAIKLNNPQDKSSTSSLLNIEPDEEDNLLTQAIIQPKSASVSSSTASKNLPIKCFNSTLLDEKCTEKTPVTFFAEMEKTPFKQIPVCSANVFKKPDKDFGILKKTSSASSTTSENYIDLLMCTPQLIKDNWSLEKSEDLEKHILAVKNRNLFGDDTEDEEDDQSDLVKLINVPKSSLDFDQLLPHLDQKPQSSKEEHNDQNDAHKIYKFNVSFGKEQDELKSKSSTSKTSSLSRDERHAARDKEREMLKRKEKIKTSQGSYKALSRRQEKNIERKEKETERKERKKEKEENNKKLLEKQKQNEEKDNKPKLKEKLRKKETKSKEISDNNKTEESQKRLQQVQFSKNNEEENDTKQETSKRFRRQISDKNEIEKSKSENKPKAMPARRLTRSQSRFEDTSPPSKANFREDDVDNIPTQPIVKVTRSRSRTKQNDSTDFTISTISTKSNQSIKSTTESSKSDSIDTGVKKTERKRRGEAFTAAIPAKIERKRLRSVHSQESPASPFPSVSISITNVDHELIKDLLKNARGLWNIAANPADSDILVMDKPLRTFKFLLAMARGIPIVTTEYLKKLNESKSPTEVHFIDYHFSDTDFEKKYKFSLLKSLQAAKKQKIFKDCGFLITANIMPIPQEIKAIIEASGGHVHNKTPPQSKENQKLYLITAKEDKKDWHKYRRLNNNIIIVSTEAIMSAIMCQSSERMRSFTLA